ncbi:hypothetical protein Dip510_000847 [Elusimicrobium posterum]|uniref:hypothetical protein n=1 Tax=Elusimicrobium posterum TaxID=3116653 RepID=UPI003C7076F5
MGKYYRKLARKAGIKAYKERRRAARPEPKVIEMGTMKIIQHDKHALQITGRLDKRFLGLVTDSKKTAKDFHLPYSPKKVNGSGDTFRRFCAMTAAGSSHLVKGL